MASNDNLPLIFDFVEFPVTAAVIITCVGIWIVIKMYSIDYPHVGISYQNFYREKNYWRMWTASFSHIDIIHLALNMTSIWAYRFVEKMIGPVLYLKHSITFVVLSVLVVMGMTHVLVHKFGRHQSAQTMAIGYSCVVFAWMAWTTVMFPTDSVNLGFFSLPISLAPFTNLLLTSIMVPRASFIGHLGGIVAGYAVGFGLMEWMTDYWFVQMLLWILLSVLLSLHYSGYCTWSFISTSATNRPSITVRQYSQFSSQDELDEIV